MKQRQFQFLLLRRALLQKKAKAILILLAITMGSSVIAALLNLHADLRSRMNRELRDYGPNVVLIPDPASKVRYLNASVLNALLSSSLKNRIVSYTPELFLPAKVNGHPALLVGADLPSLHKLYPNWIWRQSNQKGPMVGSQLGARLGLKNDASIKVEVTGRERQMQIGGFLESGESEDDQLFVDLNSVQDWSGNQGRFHVITLSVLGEINDVNKEFSAFVRENAGTSVHLIRKIASAEMSILDKISRLIGLVVSIIFVTLFFCVNTTASAILLSRQGEIALMRVLGARRKQILATLLTELLILGLAGGLFGFCIGIVMAQVLGKVLFQTLIVPHFSIFVITIVCSLLMMLVSSIVPIHRAINRQAALVLKEA